MADNEVIGGLAIGDIDADKCACSIFSGVGRRLPEGGVLGAWSIGGVSGSRCILVL